MEQRTWRLIIIIAIVGIVGIMVFYAIVLPWIGEFVTPAVNVLLTPFAKPPASTFFIFLISISISMIIQVVNRLLTDTNRRNRIMAELRKFQDLQKKAQSTGDRKLLLKVERRQKYIQKMQSDMMKMQFRPALYFFVPFLIFFQLLGGFYTDSVVAILPFDLRLFIPQFLLAGVGEAISIGSGVLPPYLEVFGLRYFFWYMISGFGLSTIMSRLFGTQPPDLSIEPTQSTRRR